MADLLTIRDLHVRFETDAGVAHAVDGVSLDIAAGEILGLVGESGCGKSASAMSIPRLLPSPPARVTATALRLGSTDLLNPSPAALRDLRGRRIGVIFQEPMTALSPLHRVGRQIVETVRLHRRVSPETGRQMALDWLARVGLPEPEATARAYPHQLSGGMQQRVMIAMALILEPELIIADEPTTALDVTIQAQVLALLRQLHRQNAALLLITHDMGVVWQMADRVAVMYAGQIVELAPAAALFTAPRHPYTEALLAAMPSEATRGRPLRAIPGTVPSPLAWPTGCRFRERCPYAFDRCGREEPNLYAAGPGRTSRCFLCDRPPEVPRP